MLWPPRGFSPLGEDRLEGFGYLTLPRTTWSGVFLLKVDIWIKFRNAGAPNGAISDRCLSHGTHCPPLVALLNSCSL
jgi:hypothetical protein